MTRNCKKLHNGEFHNCVLYLIRTLQIMRCEGQVIEKLVHLVDLIIQNKTEYLFSAYLWSVFLKAHGLKFFS